MNLVQKVGGAVASVALLGSLLAPAAFAQGTTIHGNGAGSTNTVIGGGSNTKNIVKQHTNTFAATFIDAGANSGANTASFNTGPGTTSVQTGTATNDARVRTTGGSNTASSSCGCTTTRGDNTISGNGAGSHNTIIGGNSNVNVVEQGSHTTSINDVDLSANSGGNTASFNTGGSTNIGTGSASNTVRVTTTGGDNTVNPSI
jgi:hypothetical protein